MDPFMKIHFWWLRFRRHILPACALLFVSVHAGCKMEVAPVGTPDPTPTPVSTPETPEPTPESTSEPTPESTPEPTPEPTPESTPEPTPAALSWEELSKRKDLQPSHTRIERPVAFPLVINGRTVGQTQMQAGTVVGVLGISEDTVAVAHGDKRATIPVASTTLEIQMRNLLAKSGTAETGTPVEMASVPGATPPPFQPASSPESAIASSTKIQMKDRVRAEVVRQRKTRIEGGDYDDKVERIALKIKLSNSDPKLSFENLRGTIYVFAEDIRRPGSHRLMTIQKFKASLPARGNFEFVTTEVENAYDTTYAKWGYKYSGWILAIHGADGKLELLKSTSPAWEDESKLSELKEDGRYDRTLKERLRNASRNYIEP